MCGVIGLLLRDPQLEAHLGQMLVPMIAALDERGPDSSGIAIFDDRADGRGEVARLRMSLGSDVDVDWLAVGQSLEAELHGEMQGYPFGSGFVVEVDEASADHIRGALRTGWPDVRVLGVGWDLRVLKDTGRPSQTCARYGIGGWAGHLAVAHTRMATESAVTVLHSHPFVPTPDLCVVHNGAFSNYPSVRRRLEADGVRFDSDNDSEVAARYLAARVAAGDDLEEAIRWLTKDMDGFFTLVIASAAQLLVVRDAFACKPVVVAETPGYVAVASEYRALAELPGIGEARVFEPQPEEVHTWSR